METFLNTELWRLGGKVITPTAVMVAVGVVIAAAMLSSLARSAFSRLSRKASVTAIGPLYIAGRIAGYLILFAGLIIAATTLGVNLNSLSLFAGAIGIGLGLGLQDIVKDFVSGIVLLVDRSIEVGDFIELEDGTAGEVVSVGPRATTLVTNDRVDIMMPNSVLLGGRLTNWTRNKTSRRVRVPFSVAYGTDKELVREAALEAARKVPATLPDSEDRKTQVWLVGFGSSSLNFELVVWPTLEAIKRRGSMMAAYAWALEDALRKYQIEIPFPQHDLRIRTLFGEEGRNGLDAFHNRRVRTVTAPHQPEVIGVNDAAQGLENDKG